MSFKLSTIKQAQPLVQVTADAVKVAALYAGNKVEAADVSVTEVPKLSPFGVLPVLTTPHANVCGAAAIKAVASAAGCDATQLTGRCPYQRTQIEQYFQIVPLIVQQVVDFKALEQTKATENDKINALNKLVAFVKPINETLVNSTWLLGNTFSIADIYVAFALKDAFARWMGPKKRSELVALTRWFNTVMQQKNVVKVVAEFTIQEKDVWLMPDLTIAAKPEPKKEDPISKMAKSAMNLDNIKKLYCLARPFNPDFEKDFFPIFDAEGWELYKVTFKYNKDEWTKLHMCENGVNGFINRAEACKRNSFVVLNVSQVGEYFHVHGAAIVRGNREINGGAEIPFVFASVSDAEEYAWEYVPMEKKAEFVKLFCAENIDGNEIVNRIHLK